MSQPKKISEVIADILIYLKKIIREQKKSEN